MSTQALTLKKYQDEALNALESFLQASTAGDLAAAYAQTLALQQRQSHQSVDTTHEGPPLTQAELVVEGCLGQGSRMWWARSWFHRCEGTGVNVKEGVAHRPASVDICRASLVTRPRRRRKRRC